MLLYTNTKKIKFYLEYNGSIINIDVDTSQTIKKLKEIAAKLFQPLTFEPRLMYSNKDISQNNNSIISDIFKNKQGIHLKIIPNNDHSSSSTGSSTYKSSSKSIINTNTTRNKPICECKEIIEYYCASCRVFICLLCKVFNIII